MPVVVGCPPWTACCPFALDGNMEIGALFFTLYFLVFNYFEAFDAVRSAANCDILGSYLILSVETNVG